MSLPRCPYHLEPPLTGGSGITYRPFKGRKFAEIVFCAISSDQQVKGYGAHLMSHLKVRIHVRREISYNAGTDYCA